MISLRVVEQVLIPYIAAYSSKTCLSVHHDSNTIPDYSISKIHSPFCLYATRERQIGSKCREFYNSLGDGSAKLTCPFGFEILYSKVTAGKNSIILYAIVTFDNNIFLKSVSNLSRIIKKKAKNEQEKLNVQFDEDETYFRFSSVTDVLNTLLAGRVGASIRSLSHHMLTPIQGAIADSEIIKVKSETDDDLIRLKRNISNINETAKRIQILLAEQLEFDANKVRRVTIHTTVNQITSQLNSVAVKKRIVFNNGYNNVAQSIEAIPDQFYIVMQNLIHNALKYSHSGFEDKSNTIEISYKPYESKYIQINICNIGCGITENEIESGEIFELGFRGELSDDRGRSGSGCGLYISNLIASAHNGKILVSSSKIGRKTDNGQAYKTVFSLILPVIQTN